MDAKNYNTIQKEGLMPAVDKRMSDLWMLQQKGACIHAVKQTRTCINDNYTHVLSRLTRFSRLNIIENV